MAGFTKQIALTKAKEYLSEYHIDMSCYKLVRCYTSYDEYNRSMRTYYFVFESKTNPESSIYFNIENLAGTEGYYSIQL